METPGSRPISRRPLLLGAAALLAGAVPRSARAEAAGSPSPDDFFTEQELEVPGERLARRCLLLVPRGARTVRRLVVLFHGLGETTSEAVGIRAWADRYGLAAAAARLRAPPVERTLSGVPLLTDERLEVLNRELRRRPFQGLGVACPYTPNVFRQPSTPVALDHYAAWVADALLPAVAKVAPFTAHAAVGVDGVSLGGYVSLEVFLRRPEAFGAVGAVQAAIGESQVDAYAARFAEAFERTGARPLRIATSAWDPEHKTSERLVSRLRARNVTATLEVSPGGHDQRFLREVGSLELLHYYDRTLRDARPRDASGGRPR